MEQLGRWEDMPGDLIADIFRRVALRDLAAYRCVCKAWRAVIDDGRLLCAAELRPRSLAGLFINYVDSEFNFSELFSRPSSSSSSGIVTNDIKYPRYLTIRDHCNGLLLCYRSVLNPATGRRAPILSPEEKAPPPAHALMADFHQDWFLVCDPTASTSHNFEVFLIPRVPNKDDDPTFRLGVAPDGLRTYFFQDPEPRDATLLASEWPPSPFILNVFSSSTGQWEKRWFHRDGEAAGTVADMRVDHPYWYLSHRHAVYCRAALYVHCEHYFILRLSLPDNKYQVIKPPSIAGLCERPELHLGRSEKGLYYALLDEQDRLRVWKLDESRGKTQWELNHDSVCGLLKLNCIQKDYGPWMLHDVNCNRSKEIDEEALAEHKSEWNSDDEDVLHCQDSGQNRQDGGYLEILAFHPYKEIVFMHRSMRRVIAYHWNTSKLEDLGNLDPAPRNTDIVEIGMSFPYTPCTIREFP